MTTTIDTVNDDGSVTRTITITQTFNPEQYKRMQERAQLKADQLQAQADEAAQEVTTLSANVSASEAKVSKIK